MKLKNILIVVNDINKSVEFYRQLFGLQVILDSDTNVILTEGLVLQDKSVWENLVREKVTSYNKSFELYFEDRNIQRFIEKLERLYPDTIYLNNLETYDNGKQIVRFYDLNGYIIEVGTPI